MTEEFIFERERDMLDYFRNNLADPENRAIVATETFTAAAGQTEFWLGQTLVKNVRDTITLNSNTLSKGYHYTVEYGEGKDRTKIILKTPALLNDIIVIIYSYGQSIIEREFSRTDVLLPRVVCMFLSGTENFAALGDYMDVEGVGQQGSYYDAIYRFEIRDKYATRARKIASQVFNICRKMRHANLFRVNITRGTDMQNFDYDNEKAAYVWQVSLEIQWEVMFN